MDYEKKYKKALEKARGALNDGTISNNTIAYIQDIFPELKESEDERIRKELLNAFQEADGSLYMVLTPHRRESFISWLEKQEVQKEDVYSKEFWGEIRKNLSDFLQEFCERGINTNFDKWTKSDCVNWLLWVEKQCEQKPTDEEIKTLLRTEYEKGRADAIAEMQNPAWSEEDEEFLRRAINATKDAYPMTAKWLKSLKDRVQPKQEWSKEDENILNAITFVVKNSGYKSCIGVPIEIMIDWLKTLRTQNTWKPSDKQREALEHFVRSIEESGYASPYDNNTKLLYSLLSDLKKLKGE